MSLYALVFFFFFGDKLAFCFYIGHPSRDSCIYQGAKNQKIQVSKEVFLIPITVSVSFL